jgi:L-lactate dehydrogenase complex protein LldE
MELLERLDCEVIFPLNQTCCGQPIANSGFAGMAKGCNKNFLENFSDVDYIVSPLGSCVLHIKEHLQNENESGALHIRKPIYELTEFMIDILKVEKLDSRFPHKVGLHVSCHGQRRLRVSSMSELVASAFSKPEKLLNMVKDIQIMLPERWDECLRIWGNILCFCRSSFCKNGKR